MDFQMWDQKKENKTDMRVGFFFFFQGMGEQGRDSIFFVCGYICYLWDLGYFWGRGRVEESF